MKITTMQTTRVEMEPGDELYALYMHLGELAPDLPITGVIELSEVVES